MKRWLTRKRICVFLLLVAGGAIVNIAVAWGCACRASTAGESGLGTHDWQTAVPESWPTRASFGWENKGRVMHVTQSRAYGEKDEVFGNFELHGVIRFQVGWPRRAMQWSLYGSVVSGTLDYWPDGSWNSWISGLAPTSVPDDIWQFQRRLPLMPVWPGFAINTLFYAGILWLVFVAPSALRNRRRIKRGLCPACAYPIGTSELCTECGAAVRPSHGESVLR